MRLLVKEWLDLRLGLIAALQQVSGNRGTDIGSSRRHGMNAGHHLLDRAVLENIAFASQVHCAAEEILIRMQSEKDDLCLQPALDHFPGDAEPVELRHLNIEQRDVGMELL